MDEVWLPWPVGVVEGRANESLHRTSARGLPCRRLASVARINHYCAWRIGACR